VKRCPVCSTEYPDDVRFCPNDGQTLRASGAASDLVGQVLADRYHVVRKLGEGGMGQVYLAQHVKMGRKSAIKVMSPSMAHDPEAVARFNREASNASRISHPNVCAIYDFGETPDGLIYLAMEFVEGEPLTDVLRREQTLSLDRAVRIFVQVADALQAAHDLGIVHRDLKPDNVMLARRRDGSDIVKVVDFGIAKAVGGDDTQKVTKTGLVVGTPEFMSPEQLAGDKVDGRSDTYSLALVLFKMLTGKLPFEAETVQETMIKRLTDEPLTLAEARPDLAFPPGLQGAIDVALARTPVERYQSAAKFANDLAELVGVQRGRTSPFPSTRADGEDQTQPLDSGPAGAHRRPAATRKRSLVPVIVGSVLVLGAGGAAVLVFGGGSQGAGSQTGGTVRPDTAVQVAARQTMDTAHRTRDTAVSRPPPRAPQTTKQSARPGPRRGAQEARLPTVPPTQPERPRGIDPATAGKLLYDLIERPPYVVLDSAVMIFNTPGVKNGDRAFAACLLAQAYQIRKNADSALAWARRGLGLDPSLRSCQAVVQTPGPH
jgi:serine/threonine protein kinase